jgi:drug/metabolite transporter (DMT)-like permease
MTLIGWSSVPLFIKYIAAFVDVWTQNGWRYAFAAVMWAPVLIVAHARRRVPAGLWRASVVPSIANALGQTLFTYAYYEIDVATATFGLRMQIVFLAVGAYLLFPSERALLRTPQAWIGIALVLLGIAGTILSMPEPAPTVDAAAAIALPVAHLGSRALGVAAAISSGLLFAVYGLGVRKYMHGFHPVTAFAAISQITALLCVVFMLVAARADAGRGPHDLGLSVLHLSAAPILLMILSSILGIALGHVFYYMAIARLGVAVTSGVIQLQPFCVAAAQFMVYGVALTMGQWIGGIVAVCGAVMLLHAQWAMSRTRALAPTGTIARETIPGGEPVGVEAAEMDAMPVERSSKR